MAQQDPTAATQIMGKSRIDTNHPIFQESLAQRDFFRFLLFVNH